METGDLVDDFALQNDSGESVHLSTLLQGGPVVLFFYPAAMTKGCTAESCHFRDLRGEFAALGASPVGISMDSVDKQRRFTEMHSFGFPLLSDPDGEVAARFGVKRRILTFLPVQRATFVIGTDRRVLGVVRSEIRMDDHADKALAILRGSTSTV
jgi:thioredoxin-dependent peroxiredoxin